MSDALDVLAVGAHPDDVELSCGATVALLASRGARVGILHLTHGEAGERGSAEQRHEEALQAGAALGVSQVAFLNLGDGGLRHGHDEEDAIIAVLRRWRPELILAPPPADRHPDHHRAHCLVEAACFYSGLTRRGAGRPHRPASNLCYMQHHLFLPSLIVDVTSSWELKLRALQAYKSQLHLGAASEEDPSRTLTFSREFWLSIEGRARHYGAVIGVEFGEPFLSTGPLAVSDPMAVIARGLR